MGRYFASGALRMGLVGGSFGSAQLADPDVNKPTPKEIDAAQVASKAQVQTVEVRSSPKTNLDGSSSGTVKEVAVVGSTGIQPQPRTTDKTFTPSSGGEAGQLSRSDITELLKSARKQQARSVT